MRALPLLFLHVQRLMGLPAQATRSHRRGACLTGPDSLAQQGQRLVVTGQVRQFNLEELEGELELDLDSGIFAGWENRLVIMTEAIREG